MAEKEEGARVREARTLVEQVADRHAAARLVQIVDAQERLLDVQFNVILRPTREFRLPCGNSDYIEVKTSGEPGPAGWRRLAAFAAMAAGEFDGDAVMDQIRAPAATPPTPETDK